MGRIGEVKVFLGSGYSHIEQAAFLCQIRAITAGGQGTVIASNFDRS